MTTPNQWPNVLLTEADLKEIAAMRVAAQARPLHQKRYWEIYQTLADKLANTYGYVAAHPTLLWLRGATQANKGVGAYSTIIRTYTDMQYKLRYNQELGDDLMQQASDKVAENLLLNLFGEGDNPSERGILPSIDKIALYDAKGVGEVLFNGDLNDSAARDNANSAWSGTLLFGLLFSDQTYRLRQMGDEDTVDNLSDIRDILFAAYSYYKAIQAATSVSNSLSLASTFFPQSQGQAVTDTNIGFWTLSSFIANGNGNVWDAVTLGTDNLLMKSFFQLISKGSPEIFLDMLKGSKEGKAQIGQTTNFEADAYNFFNIGSSLLQNTKATLQSYQQIQSQALVNGNSLASLAARNSLKA